MHNPIFATLYFGFQMLCLVAIGAVAGYVIIKAVRYVRKTRLEEQMRQAALLEGVKARANARRAAAL